MAIAMSISILVRGMFGTILEKLLNMYQILYVGISYKRMIKGLHFIPGLKADLIKWADVQIPSEVFCLHILDGHGQ